MLLKELLDYNAADFENGVSEVFGTVDEFHAWFNSVIPEELVEFGEYSTADLLVYFKQIMDK